VVSRRKVGEAAAEQKPTQPQNPKHEKLNPKHEKQKPEARKTKERTKTRIPS
jgi:hypothetical protein